MPHEPLTAEERATLLRGINHYAAELFTAKERIDALQAENADLKALVAVLTEEKHQTTLDMKPLHDLIQSNRDWVLEAWGKNICAWAVGKIQTLEARIETLEFICPQSAIDAFNAFAGKPVPPADGCRHEWYTTTGGQTCRACGMHRPAILPEG